MKEIYAISLEEIITSSTASRVKDAIDKAAENNTLLLIELNTPGGVLDATRALVTHITSSPVPVIVHVTPSGGRAASAGIFITMAANFAVMDEGTNIGAAHPVSADGGDIEGDMRLKAENDTVAFARAIAEKRGRNADIAEKMVKESTSYTPTTALENNIIDAIVTDGNIKSLIQKKFDIKEDIKIIHITPSFIQSVSKFLANPDILAALLFLGILMITLEFKVPGTFIFAGIGGVAFILFAIGANIIPINYLAVLLIFAGFGLLIAEIFVTSFGLLAIGGIVSFLFGLRMLFDRAELTGVSVSIGFTIFITVIVASIALLIGRLVIKDYKRRPASGMETMLDKTATTIEWAGNKGRITIYGEIWNAESEDTIQEGDRVTIIAYNGMALKVRKID